MKRGRKGKEKKQWWLYNKSAKCNLSAMISLWIFRLCPSTFHFVFALFSLRNALRFLSMYFPVYICVLKCSIFSEIVQFLLNNLSVISHFVGIQQIAIVEVEAKFIVFMFGLFSSKFSYSLKWGLHDSSFHQCIIIIQVHACSRIVVHWIKIEWNEIK